MPRKAVGHVLTRSGAAAHRAASGSVGPQADIRESFADASPVLVALGAGRQTAATTPTDEASLAVCGGGSLAFLKKGTLSPLKARTGAA